ncbi:non-ribosomal peptide synthetase [Actinokineospora diospyrosa]|uniref:Phenyloxazoline synthase MbtB n=1 Tax=Actinokineospora diospyrosa TaxID=103728 RepID=A0ABT1I674_9PSEU|nr:amino acid adenylation domain-containing protein [Actinokineospora diospyrosa]MCP2268113.1 mycobactin phenyloxazoline synthetase [Actinokineospora diospyrosa]
MSAVDYDALLAAVAELTEEEPGDIAAGTNLFELGLDSIALMKLVGGWRRAGVVVDFAELAANPTLGAWSALLAERSGTPAEAAEAVTDVVTDVDGPFPLAVLQHAYWVGRAPGQRLGGVAAHLYTEFDGAGVDPGRLSAAVERLIDRHDMLRVVLSDNGDQRIAPTSGWRGLTVHDLRDTADADRELAAIRDANSHQLLDIERGEVFATALSLLPGGRTRLHVDVDMVAADAVSYRVLLADLARYYQGETDDEPLGYSYRQYRGARRQDEQDKAARWWRDRLTALPGAPDLPRAARDSERPRVTRRAVVLPAAERAALAERAKERGVTVAMAVATAFAEVVGRWSARGEFLLNVPMFDREPLHPDVARLVGDFTSSILLAVDLTAPATFAERVRQVQARAHEDAAHAAHSGVEVLRDLTRLHGEQVLAPVVFTSALNLGELFDDRVRASFGAPVWIISQGPQVLLDAQVTELDGGLLVNWDCRDDEVADGVLDAMFAAFADLVHLLAADPIAWDAPVLAALPDAQRARRERANDTTLVRVRGLLHEGFFACAAANPDAPAILGDEVITYGQLADRALRAAGELVRLGVTPGDTVAVSLPKGPEQIIAVLGVLAAGGTYVPIGVEQPPARVDRIVALAKPRALITELPDGEPLAEPVFVDPARAAYILFTSGSTGEPKGVEVPHQAAMATIDDLVARFAIGPDDRTLALSALDFDLSVFDLFAPLSVGGAVVPVTEDRRDAAAWGGLVAARGVTIVNCVPALLDMLLSSGAALGSSLRVVLLGGDWVGVDLPGRLAAAVPGCRFVALGGTTETAIHSTVCEVSGPVPEDWRSVPYGTPLGGVRLRVVDHLGRDAPDWVPGELWIGGAGVAAGYRGDPERTADRFVIRDGLRWYRTGDLARYRGDGVVEFLGRRDHQVKVRGYRVELGEVEAALQANPAIRAAVAVTTPAGLLGAGVVAEGEFDEAAVRAAAGELLPAHMVPEVVVAIESVPLTANGKVDRGAVRDLVGHPARAGGPHPRTPLERVVALAWREVLEVDAVGVHDEFFRVGGDSVLATAVVAHLRSTLDTTEVSVRALFGAPTIAGFAAALAGGQRAAGRLEAVAELFWEIEGLSDDEVVGGLADERTEAQA